MNILRRIATTGDFINTPISLSFHRIRNVVYKPNIEYVIGGNKSVITKTYPIKEFTRTLYISTLYDGNIGELLSDPNMVKIFNRFQNVYLPSLTYLRLLDKYVDFRNLDTLSVLVDCEEEYNEVLKFGNARTIDISIPQMVTDNHFYHKSF